MACLVVKSPFPFNGRNYKVGDVLFDADAETVSNDAGLAVKCSRVADDAQFEHLRAKAPRPEVVKVEPAVTAPAVGDKKPV